MTPSFHPSPSCDRWSRRGAAVAAFLVCCGSGIAQTTVAITGGDAGQGLTLDPAKVIYAYNIRGVSDLTVQGVQFTNLELGNGQATATGDNPFAGGENSADDDALRSVLQTMSFDGGGSHPNQITFTGLVPSATYRIDLLHYSGNWNFREQAVLVNGSLVGLIDTSKTVARNTYFDAQADGGGIIGLLVVASSPYGGAGQQDGSLINAVVLSGLTAIPEPASAAGLAGLGVLAGAALRRRRRAA